MRVLMRPIIGIGIVISSMCSSCAGDPKHSKAASDAPPEHELGAAPPPAPPTAVNNSQASAGPCLVVQGDFAGQPSTVEGILKVADGNRKSPAPLVLRLARPRCVVGLEHASYIVEVYVASTGTDLRPLIDSRVRITGDVLGGTTDMGGAAVVLLAKDVERVRTDD